MSKFSDLYNPPMKIESQEEADAYFERLVGVILEANPDVSRARAEGVVRDNLGYWAGYFDDATRERVERLFKCAHPVFGAFAVKGPLSPEEALRMGMELAARWEERNAALGCQNDLLERLAK
jgi:hypothetical protein